ncbi:hypothetical protein D3C81_1824220 [compost metagenome]
MQLHLVEERAFAGMRMTDDGRAPGANLQGVIVQPRPLDAAFSAARFNLAALLGLEEVLPWHIEVAGEGAHVKQALLFQGLAQRRRQLAVHDPAIDHRCRAAHR